MQLKVYTIRCLCAYAAIAHSRISPELQLSMPATQMMHAVVQVWVPAAGASCGVHEKLPLCPCMTLACACSAAVINWGLLVLILYALYYTALEPVAGASWGALLGLPMWLTATAFYQHVPHAWAWALGLHILSWIMQVCHAQLPCPLQLWVPDPVPARVSSRLCGQRQHLRPCGGA